MFKCQGMELYTYKLVEWARKEGCTRGDFTSSE